MTTQVPRPRTWLNDSAFNLLIDYYPEVQFRPYGSGCTRENTLPWLKELEPGYVCIYVKGHSGYTTWRSSLKTEQRMLAQDMPRLFRDLTREAGCKLVLYYSGLLDGIAGQRNPDWVMHDIEGEPKQCLGDFKNMLSYGICPQSAYWEQWASIQLRELIEGYDPDGIWVDGDWPGPCYCPRCQARFRDDTGWNGAWSDLRRREGFDIEYAKTWKRIEHEWRARFSSYIKSLKPDCVYSAGNVSPRREFADPFDWRSGDFFSPGYFSLNDMARMMRWYGTLDVPADAYVCDTSFTHARTTVRSRTKSAQRMMQEAATVAATGGAVGYWTYPLGNGALVPSRMRKAIAVRRFIKQREHLFLGSRSAQWTAVICSDPGIDTLGDSAVAGAHQALAALHRSPDVMDETGVTPDMPHHLLVLPEQRTVDDPTVERLEAFVRNGGALLSTGPSLRSEKLAKLLGVTAVHAGAVADGHVLLKNAPFGEPVGIDSSWDRLITADAQELYPLYLSWDQFNPECRLLNNNWPMHGQVDEEDPEPAGFAAAIVRRLGKGVAVHVGTDLFSKYRRLGDPQMLRWIDEILTCMPPTPLFTTDAPSWVDVALRRNNDRLLIHFVNHSPGRDVARLHTDDLWVDEIPQVGPINCAVRCAAEPSAVMLEPEHQPLDYAFDDGVLTVTLPRLVIHGCIAIEGWESGDER